jgi:ribosome-binding protein aMBF1 (putative translation factor)
MKRKKTKKLVTRRVRRYRMVTVTKAVIQCERPYVLFGEAVRAARFDRGWTQQDLADALKLSRGSIANIEVGRQRVLLSDVFDFAKVLKVSPKWLFNAVSQ